MPKYSTGKPPTDKLTVADLPPIDKQTSSICTMHEAAAYMRAARPKTYKLIKSGALECVRVGDRRYVTTASIKRTLSGKHRLPKKPPRFKAIRRVPKAKKAA